MFGGCLVDVIVQVTHDDGQCGCACGDGGRWRNRGVKMEEERSKYGGREAEK